MLLLDCSGYPHGDTQGQESKVASAEVTYPALHPLAHEDAELLDKSDRIRLADRQADGRHTHFCPQETKTHRQGKMFNGDLKKISHLGRTPGNEQGDGRDFQRSEMSTLV